MWELKVVPEESWLADKKAGMRSRGFHERHHQLEQDGNNQQGSRPPAHGKRMTLRNQRPVVLRNPPQPFGVLTNDQRKPKKYSQYFQRLNKILIK